MSRAMNGTSSQSYGMSLTISYMDHLPPDIQCNASEHISS